MNNSLFFFGLILFFVNSAFSQQIINNPYCNVPTYIIQHEPRNAGVNLDASGHYYITISYGITRNQALARGILAHECGHVYANDIHRPRPTKVMELDADCYAASQLCYARDFSAKAALQAFVSQSGSYPSGPPGYPSGNRRYNAVQACWVNAGCK